MTFEEWLGKVNANEPLHSEFARYGLSAWQAATEQKDAEIARLREALVCANWALLHRDSNQQFAIDAVAVALSTPAECPDCGGSGYMSDGRGSGEPCGCNAQSPADDWKCARCGRFVPAYTSHACASDSRRPQGYYTRPSIDQDELFRKLNRIIELLEMLTSIRR